MIFVFFGLPLAVFLVLALLPRGRLAAVGIVGVAVLGLLGWAATGDDEAGEYNRILLAMLFVGLAMAGLAQGLRLVLPAGGPGWVYALVIAGVVGLALAGSRIALGAY